MQAGKVLYENALAAVNSKIAADGREKQAVNEKKRTQKLAYITYQGLKKVSNAIFKDKSQILVSLGIIAPMPRDTSNFLATSQALFENVGLPEVTHELLLYGYDSTKLTNERAVMATFEKAVETKERASAASQLATQDQKTALKKLSDWRQQYLKIARVALRERSELLEKLGVRIYSSRTPAQRNAPKKAAATRLQKKEQNQAKNTAENPSEKKAE